MTLGGVISVRITLSSPSMELRKPMRPRTQWRSHGSKLHLTLSRSLSELSTYHSLYRDHKFFLPRYGSENVRALRCSRTPPKATKVCPVCDATIEADARNCPSCLTDLSLFDLGGGSEDVHVGEGKNIDDILASIM